MAGFHKGLHLYPQNKPDLSRLRRMQRARSAGVSLADIAERFGLKDRRSAHHSLVYARKMLEKYECVKS